MIDLYAKALGKAFTHRRTALHLELAVGLCVFHDNKSEEPAQARVELVRCYAETGYECMTPAGSDYKTVNRRVNTAWLLWEYLGGARKVRLGRVNGTARIDAAKKIVEALEVRSVYDVMELVGRSQRRERDLGSEHATDTTQSASSANVNASLSRRATDAPGVVHVKTRHIDVPIPPDATKRELLTLADKLIKLAEKLGENEKPTTKPPRKTGRPLETP